MFVIWGVVVFFGVVVVFIWECFVVYDFGEIVEVIFVVIVDVEVF